MPKCAQCSNVNVPEVADERLQASSRDWFTSRSADMNAIEKRIYELAKPYLTVRENDLHTRVAFDLALDLLGRVGGNRRVVGPAIILHDVGWFKVPAHLLEQWRAEAADNESITRIHEEEGVKIAKGILEEVGYDSSLASEILRIIDCHDTGGDPQSVEEGIVRAADVLWRYSKDGFGVMIRVFSSTPVEMLERLESGLDEWFFIPVSRQLAEDALEEWKREVAADHPGMD